MESAPPLCCHVAHVHHSLGVICIHVEDGSVDHSGHICRVRRRTCHPGICGEANLCGREELVVKERSIGEWTPPDVESYLVVDHHMYGAMCGVGRQVGQVERLVDDPLACERSIAVKQDRHHLGNRSSIQTNTDARRLRVGSCETISLLVVGQLGSISVRPSNTCRDMEVITTLLPSVSPQ